MKPRELSYQCRVCGWQGLMEPVDFGDSAPCPDCGCYLYPLTWMQTWGFAIMIILACVGLVAFVAYSLYG